MNTLYHGSYYNHNILQSGYKRSGIHMKWDETESNHYLYFTGNKDTAILMGFASAISTVLDHVKTFDIKGKNIHIELYEEGDLSSAVLDANIIKTIILYEVDNESQLSKMEKVDNKHNGLTDEYKTKSDILYSRKTEVDINKWLDENGYKVKFKVA